MNPKTNPTFSQHAPMKILPGCLEVWIFPHQNSSWGKRKRSFSEKRHVKNILQETNISPKNGTFEDDFPFPKVGYVNPLIVIAPENGFPFWVSFRPHFFLGEFLGPFQGVEAKIPSSKRNQTKRNLSDSDRWNPHESSVENLATTDVSTVPDDLCVFLTAEC